MEQARQPEQAGQLDQPQEISHCWHPTGEVFLIGEFGVLHGVICCHCRRPSKVDESALADGCKMHPDIESQMGHS